jgi:type II secretion system protein C
MVLVALCGAIGFVCVQIALLIFVPDSYFPVSSQSIGISDTPAKADGGATDFDFGINPFSIERSLGGLGERSLPESDLELTLFGLRSGDAGSAIIQPPDGRQAIFQIGDEIVDGVQLVAVHRDHIVIHRNGREERLTFLEELHQTIRPLSGGQADFLSAIRLNRIVEDGKTLGFEIRLRDPAIDVLRPYRLQEGDIVIAIDGNPIATAPVDFRDLSDRLNKGQAIVFTLLRQGAELELMLVQE